MLLAVVGFSQSYYIHTANKSGNWSTPANWNSQLRNDGTSKTKYIIPAAINIIIDNSTSLASTNVEIYIEGTLTIAGSINLDLTTQSSILLSNGTISGSSANQKIKIGGVLKYKGNTDGVRTGYFLVDNSTGTSPNGFMAYSVLSVNFTSFYISESSGNIQLTWSTDNERNNSHFDVERSFNGLQWQKIAEVAGAGNSNNTNNYKYNDKNVSNPIVYYRLRQVDNNSHASYSSIKMIRSNEANSPVKIFAADKNVVIDLNTSIKGSIRVQVLNNSGQVISQHSYTNSSYRINLKLNNVASGAYIVHVSTTNGWSQAKKVIL
jgi:hypothetical protein